MKPLGVEKSQLRSSIMSGLVDSVPIAIDIKLAGASIVLSILHLGK